MALPERWLDELIAKNDIATVISSYTELKPKGGRLWGLCPLHGEKTPSFSVQPDKQMFYCFGCHAGGTVIQFIMQMERLEYYEAIKFLAERVGMSLPDQTDSYQLTRERARKARLLEALNAAARYYCERFIAPEGAPGREYAAKRGLSKEIVLRFGIGWAPESWDGLINHLGGLGYSREELKDAGLVIHNAEKGRWYDAYRGRLIFPICGGDGRVLGFGARVLDDSTPKYINTGDTPVYNKRNNLYGLYLHKRASLADVVMVEGYMDVIGLYKAGITNVVASLGTALTQQQAQLLKSWSVGTVYIAYDGDAAGQNAMLRGMDILAGKGLKVRVIRFPDGLDPDEYVQVYGSSGFYRLKEQAITHNAFALETMARDVDFSDENAREQYAKAACRYVAGLQPIEQERYYGLVAEKTGYSVETLKAQGGSLTQAELAPGPRSFTAGGIRKRRDYNQSARDIAERTLLHAALSDPAALTEAVSLGAGDKLRGEAQRKLFGELCVRRSAFRLADYVRQLPSEEAESVSELLRLDDAEGDAVRAVRDCLLKLAALDRNERYEELKAALFAGGLSDGERISAMQEMTDIQKQRK